MQLLRNWLLAASAIALAACPDGKDEPTSTTGSATEATTGSATEATSGGTTEEPTSGGSTGEGSATGATTEAPPATCQEILAQEGEALVKICGCLVERMEFPDVETCVMGNSTPPEIQHCMCGVYDASPGGLEGLECESQAFSAFADCVSMIACTDEAAYTACLDPYSATMCPFDKDTEGALDLQCFGQDAFQCGSGEEIPHHYACDMEMDCRDGSDEVKELCVFTCGSGEEIPEELRCDGSADCLDGSDEASCP